MGMGMYPGGPGGIPMTQMQQPATGYVVPGQPMMQAQPIYSATVSPTSMMGPGMVAGVPYGVPASLPGYVVGGPAAAAGAGGSRGPPPGAGGSSGESLEQYLTRLDLPDYVSGQLSAIGVRTVAELAALDVQRLEEATMKPAHKATLLANRPPPPPAGGGYYRG